MQFNGRQVLAIVLVSILASSLVTMLVIGTDDLPLQGKELVESNGEQAAEENGAGFDLKKIEEVYQTIKEHYVFEVDDEALIEGAVQGMMSTLDDPYSEYLSPEAARQLQESLSSSFEGIGAEVTMQDGRVTIVAPIKDSPAEKAGLRPMDQIISVNGEKLENMNLYEAVLKIRGPQGSVAELEIVRPGVDQPFKVEVVREEIPIETVYSKKVSAENKTFGWLQITSFGENTAERFAEELTKLEQAQIDGLIIDVRGNPGGYLEAVRQIGQMLVPYESVITEIEDKTGERMVYRSTLEKPKPYPIAVLIDKGSASASEILAAALKEAGQYKLVGQATFGKGTVQNTINLADQSQIKITIAKWLTPKENWINQKGVEPDVEVEQPDYFYAAYVSSDPILERDMNNNQVRNLQVVLAGLGYDPGRKDGYFSLETEQAVKSFQADHDLPVTGRVDQQTAEKINEQLLAKVQDPRSDLQLQKAVEVLLKQLNSQ